MNPLHVQYWREYRILMDRSPSLEERREFNARWLALIDETPLEEIHTPTVRHMQREFREVRAREWTRPEGPVLDVPHEPLPVDVNGARITRGSRVRDKTGRLGCVMRVATNRSLVFWRSPAGEETIPNEEIAVS